MVQVLWRRNDWLNSPASARTTLWLVHRLLKSRSMSSSRRVPQALRRSHNASCAARSGERAQQDGHRHPFNSYECVHGKHRYGDTTCTATTTSTHEPPAALTSTSFATATDHSTPSTNWTSTATTYAHRQRIPVGLLSTTAVSPSAEPSTAKPSAAEPSSESATTKSTSS